jgi:hypothetical protein
MTKAKTPAKPRKTADKAKRPSPPDRDGDGKSGGSRQGNTTDPAATGTAQAALAAQEIAANGHATIIIHGVTTGRKESHPLGVNGKVRHLAVNAEVQVDAAELAALEASHVQFETVIPLSETAADAGSASDGSASEPASPPAPTTETEPPVTEPPVVEEPAQTVEGEEDAQKTAAPAGGEGTTA